MTNAAPQQQQSLSRMTLASVQRGTQKKPLRALLYGVEGVGKSTFASRAPAPIFLCVEDGVAHLDVARFSQPRTWADVLECVRVLTHEEHTYKTLVVDTLDWLEPLCWAAVCQLDGKRSIEDFGYGKGYVAALEQWRILLGRLDMLVKTRKVHVVFLAHAQIKKVDDPQTGPFDRYQMKLHDKAAALLREWVDAILFARHEVMVLERRGQKARGASSGARVMHTQWTAAYDAKNRFDLPETLPLDWGEFSRACQARSPAEASVLRAELRELLAELPQEERLKGEKAIAEWAGDDAARLAQLVDKARGKVGLLRRPEATIAVPPDPPPPGPSADPTTQRGDAYED